MKCPSCGKNVRSKRQCAHCGYVFGSSDLKAHAHKENKTSITDSEKNHDTKGAPLVSNERAKAQASSNQSPAKHQDLSDKFFKTTDASDLSQETRSQEPKFAEANYHVTPKTPKKGFSLGRFIWNLIKLLLFIAIVFLLFMFGPQMFTAVKNVVTGKQEISEVVPKDLNDIVPADLFGSQESQEGSQGSQADKEASSGDLDTDKKANQTDDDKATNDKTDKDSDKDADTSSEKDSATDSALTLKDHKVNLDDYPVINIDFDFEGNLDDINKDTFKFNLTSNGEAKEMSEQYSLLKEGQHIKLSYADPSANLLSADAVKQTLKIEAKDFGFEEAISYELPSSKVNQETQDAFNEIITQNLSDLGDVSAYVKSIDQDEPINFAYENASVDASNLISWFILERVHEAIRDDELTADTIVKINPGLMASNDQGEVASVGEGTEYLLTDLINLMIQSNDVTAMNHLINEVGGANEFNLWLNESNYFATKVTKKLSYTDEDTIDGAVTNAQDLGRLMEALAKDDLVSKDMDAQIKELLMSTPRTEKFIQAENSNVTDRYEITTADTNPSAQHYTGIVETDLGKYVIAILVSDVNDSAAALPAINQTMQDILMQVRQGEDAETSEEETSQEASEEEASQAPESEAPVTSQAPQTQAPQTEYSSEQTNFDQVYQDENGEYAVQPVQGQDPVLLPVIRDDNGNPIQVQWYYDEAAQMYRYN